MEDEAKLLKLWKGDRYWDEHGIEQIWAKDEIGYLMIWSYFDQVGGAMRRIFDE